MTTMYIVVGRARLNRSHELGYPRHRVMSRVRSQVPIVMPSKGEIGELLDVEGARTRLSAFRELTAITVDASVHARLVEVS